MITKKTLNYKSSYEILEKCLNDLLKYCLKEKINIVAFSKSENGIDKLNWRRVAALINKILVANRIECEVYTSANLDLKYVEARGDSIQISPDIKLLPKAVKKCRSCLIEQIRVN